MKIIFLDIDGVLNNQQTVARCGSYIGIDKYKVKLLRTLVEATGAKIVLVSSWKNSWERIDKDFQSELGNYLDRKLKQERLYILDKTYEPKGSEYRGDGILRWLSTLSVGRVDQFVILDDELFDYSSCGLLPNLVQTTFDSDTGGLSEEHVELAIQLLNKTNS